MNAPRATDDSKSTKTAGDRGEPAADCATKEQMKTGAITREGLRAFASSLSHTTLETSIRHRRFFFYLNDHGFHYLPESSGIYRIQGYQYIDKVIERYNEIRSLNTKDYTDITRNASYLLVLIERYRDALSRATSDHHACAPPERG